MLLSIGTLTLSVLYGVFYFYLNALYNEFEVVQLSTVGITPASLAATLATALGVVLVVAAPVTLGVWLITRVVRRNVFRRRQPGRARGARPLPRSTTSRLALVFLGSAAILGVLVFFEARGTADARQLKRFAELGHQVDDSRRSLLLSFTGQPAQLVEPRWTASPPPLRFGRGELVLYLGQAEGTIVVWRPLTRAVLKIPAGSVVLVIPRGLP